MAYPHPIHKNALPHCDVFMENDYTKEEMKLVYETHKILGDSSIGITATAIRIPVVGGHSESVNLEFEKPYTLDEIRRLLEQTPGVVVLDNPEKNAYPMPIHAEGKDEVFVGRIRRDESVENAVNLWIVADNLRKGAATNTIQIAEYLIQHQLV
jgi:aspartate-semialdehyde dehydrogenase